MNDADTIASLKIRRDLTGESFNDGTVDAWAQALKAWPLAAVRGAMVKAARTHGRVNVAHVVEHLPRPDTTTTTAPTTCEQCDGTGWVDASTTVHGSTSVRPCKCSRGADMETTHRRINEANR